jgi:hypothetical protein
VVKKVRTDRYGSTTGCGNYDPETGIIIVKERDLGEIKESRSYWTNRPQTMRYLNLS